MTRNLFLIGALLTMVACTQPNRPAASPCNSPNGTTEGNTNTGARNKPEVSRPAVVFIVVDGMTKVQGIT